MIPAFFPQFKCFRVPVTSVCCNWVRHHPRPHRLGCWLLIVQRAEKRWQQWSEPWKWEELKWGLKCVDISNQLTADFFFFFGSGDIRTCYIQEQRYFTHRPRLCAEKSDTHRCFLLGVSLPCANTYDHIFLILLSDIFLWVDLLINKFHLSLRPQSEVVLGVL